MYGRVSDSHAREDVTDDRPTFTYLSLGAGVQSSAVLAMSALGLRGCPRADVAIFADTQDEPQWVYDHLTVLQTFGVKHGLEVVTTTIGKLSEHLQALANGETKFANIPAWTLGRDGNAGILRRQCTREFKIAPLEQEVRRRLGYVSRQRVKHAVRVLIGISLDEAIRAKPARTTWVTALHPLLDARMDRQACKELLVEVGLPVPNKSSCVYCPFHSYGFWRELKYDHPAEWAKAVAVDQTIRNMSKLGLRNPIYLNPALKPLEELNLAPEQLSLFGDGFGNECDGYCGV